MMNEAGTDPYRYDNAYFTTSTSRGFIKLITSKLTTSIYSSIVFYRPNVPLTFLNFLNLFFPYSRHTFFLIHPQGNPDSDEVSDQ